jgi:formate hydrogenlyase transcriptional activator
MESTPTSFSQSQIEQYRILVEVSEAIAHHADLGALLKDLSHLLPRVIAVNFLGLSLYDAERRVMRLHTVQANVEADLIGGHEEPLDATPAGTVWETQQPLIIRDVTGERRWPTVIAMMQEDGVQSCCFLPLTTAAKRIGVLVFASMQGDAYNEASLEFLRHVGRQVAVAVANVLNWMSAEAAQQALAGERDRLSLLLDITHAVTATLDLKELLQAIARSLRRLVPHDRTALLLYEPDPEQFRMRALDFDLGKGLLTEGSATPVEGTPAGMAVRSRQPVYCGTAELEGFRSDVASRLLAEGVRSVFCIPLLSHDHVLGVLTISSLTERSFGAADMMILEQAAKPIAVAVENALNYEQAQKARQELAHERDRLNLLLAINNAVASHLELRPLFDSIKDGIRRVLKADAISLTLLDQEVNQLKLYALDFPGSKGFIEEGTACTLCGCPASSAIAAKQPVVLSRTELEQSESTVSQRLLAEGVRTACCVPLLWRDRTLGALNIGSLQNDAFTGADAEMLGEVGKQIALAVANSMAYQEIATLKDKLSKEKLYLEEEIQTDYNFEEIVGDSRALKQVLKDAQTVAKTDSTVLILGETGSGKELIARALHNLSDRRERTFVKLNCAAIPTGLLESELFGHEKGAFTGAIATKIGRFELADRGTLFLDEVGEIPLELQVKLLRVLQEQEFERLGSTRTIRVHVRIIAATNRDLSQMVEEQKFRSDLYYRLKVFPITVPPLRERPEDIPLLVRHFAQKFASRMKKRIETIPVDAMKALQAYAWPGNIRELENFIERAVILSSGSDLFVSLVELKRPAHVSNGAIHTLQEAERDHILKVLRETNWVIGGLSGAAAKLGMKRTTLQSKMQKLDIVRPQ